MIVSVAKEFEQAIEEDIQKINIQVVNFHRELVKAAPVAPIHGGNFRRSWRLSRDGKLHWTIKNDASYASILWAGRHPGTSKLGNPKWYGSLQWPQGGEPMLAKFKYRLNRI